ncbi:hypothetical protein CWI37_0445p0030 [Hamiltosporidium tvaerminnensis]|uniref:Uncharacterized protein n=1 Tax=Hamiltosporidium tvaerminnensis TaxID=1176355 RepID=A0A4Q9L626_9MICR|nr:hypothetical protein CWI37_0445p0030 [Hamiltosporidium tvaerminnensis]
MNRKLEKNKKIKFRRTSNLNNTNNYLLKNIKDLNLNVNNSKPSYEFLLNEGKKFSMYFSKFNNTNKYSEFVTTVVLNLLDNCSGDIYMNVSNRIRKIGSKKLIEEQEYSDEF